jgi:Ca-activated chloride channel family protein
VKQPAMSPFSKRRLSFWAMAVSVLLAGSTAYAQDRSAQSSVNGKTTQQGLSVSTDLVLLPVSVTDENGNFVPGLTKQDFQVFEDKQLQKITFFQEQDTPVTVGLIVDHSSSMAGKLADVADAVSAFAHSSNPLDEMFVVDFGDSVSVELLGGKPFTSDPAELEKAVAMVSANGQTALYDAVAEGFIHVKLGRWEKKALIIVSDGGDNVSHYKYSQILAMARSSRAVIYAIGLVGVRAEEENPKVLKRLCKDTGGIAFFPPKGESIIKVSQQIARDLREQYTLGYVPGETRGADSYRAVEVKVTAPGHEKINVRTRRGYSLAKQPVAQSGRGAP